MIETIVKRMWVLFGAVPDAMLMSVGAFSGVHGIDIFVHGGRTSLVESSSVNHNVPSGYCDQSQLLATTSIQNSPD